MENNNNILALSFLRSHPEKAARILEQLDFKEVAEFIKRTPHTYATPVFEQLLPHQAAAICTLMGESETASVLSDMRGRRAAAILRHIKKKSRLAILARLPTKAAQLFGLFISYSEDTVGAWMNPEAVVLPADCTVAEALGQLEKIERRIGTDIVFVVDRNLHIQGSLHACTLLGKDPQMPVTAVIELKKHVLTARASLVSIQNHPGWETENVLPVLDGERQFIGVLRHCDMHQGLRRVWGGIQEPAQSDPMTGIWEVYGKTLFALMDAAGGVGTGFRNPPEKDS